MCYTKACMNNKLTNKEKILAEAHKRMEDGTFESITIRQICEAADASIGSFYHHFSSKDDLVLYTYTENADYLLNNIQQLNSKNEWDNLRMYVDYQIDETLRSSLSRTRFVYTYNINHGIDPHSKHREILRKLLTRAKEKGQMNNNITIDEFLDFFFVIIAGTMTKYCMKNGEYDIQNNLRTQVNSLISYAETK